MIIHDMIQGSSEWHRIRTAKLTSTSFKSVIASKGKPLLIMDKMIAEEVTGMSSDADDYISDEMQRGIDLEPIAKKEYEATTGNKVRNVGFLQSSRWEQFGLSPDGLVDEDGATEFKCPDTKTHIRYIREGVLPKEYDGQALCYFMVYEELEWLDFVSYDPRFTPHPLFIIRITREELERDIENASEKVDRFFKDYEIIKNAVIFGTSVYIAQLDKSVNATLIQSA